MFRLCSCPFKWHSTFTAYWLPTISAKPKFFNGSHELKEMCLHSYNSTVYCEYKLKISVFIHTHIFKKSRDSVDSDSTLKMGIQTVSEWAKCWIIYQLRKKTSNIKHQ
jgi:hypothetical protein